MWKKIIIVQTIVCLMLALSYTAIGNDDSKILIEKRDLAVSAMSKHYSIRDIADKGKAAVINVIKAPAAVTAYIISSQEKQEFGDPVDELQDGETGPVYSVAGGRVKETGRNADSYFYVVITHDDKISKYDNCDEIYVKESEHVRKGQIIASFTEDGQKEFRYSLNEKD